MSDIKDLVNRALRKVYDRNDFTKDEQELAIKVGSKLYDQEVDGFGKSQMSVEFGSPDWATLAELRYNAYVFSVFKNHSFMGDISQLLVDEKDNIRSFADFKAFTAGLEGDYFSNWLEAEYDTAVATGQMAARWQEIQKEKDLFPFLQYQTVGDARVRPEHEILDGVVYPVDHPFWDSFMPPNGWRCRCDVIQVSGPEQAANELPKLPPGFNHNSGSSMRIATEDHPYFQGLSQEKKDSLIGRLVTEIFRPDKLKGYPVDLDPVMFQLMRHKPTVNMRKNLKGSSFNPADGSVSISTGDRWQRSNIEKTGVIYHELGHAAHYSRNLVTFKYVDPILDDVFKRCQAAITGNEKRINDEIMKILRQLESVPRDWEFKGLNRYDYVELLGAAADTLEALTKGRWGWGHGRNYYNKISNGDRMEWFAHASENRFMGNPVFQELMPEVYDLMVSYIRSIE